MKTLRNIAKQALRMSLATCLATTMAWAGNGAQWGSPTSHGGIYDTSFALEAESTCLSGCHESNTTLLESHANSYMTHVMVKCNACHGTHTASEVGKVKPNLTGYTASSGITGYKVPKDRCLTCHSSMLTSKRHPKNSSECLSCHGAHDFTPPNR